MALRLVEEPPADVAGLARGRVGEPQLAQERPELEELLDPASPLVEPEERQVRRPVGSDGPGLRQEVGKGNPRASRSDASPNRAASAPGKDDGDVAGSV